MRHFEKRGKLGLFRRVDVRGATVDVVVGVAADTEERVTIRCRSARAAAGVAGTWARWALEAGYAEVPLPKGVRLGVVATVRAPEGPGRIRLDGSTDVLFPKGERPYAVGDRVMVTGVHRAKRPPPWMFGSALRVKSVAPFPAVRWSAFRAKADPPASIRTALERMAGEPILGHQDRTRPFPKTLAAGALIFSYDKGVHRFLRRAGGMILSEPVLTSKFGRCSERASSCVPVFCEPVPARLAREIARRFGL